VRGLGTIVNVATVLGGSLGGLALGARMPERMRQVAFQGVGLVTVVLGIRQAVTTRNLVFPMLAIVLGGLIGEAVNIEGWLERLGDRFRQLVERPRADDEPASTFAEGFVSATLIFSIGPLTILGSISDGLGNGAQLLFIKAGLDGTMAIVLASTLGMGVVLSALSVLVIQGALTLGAAGLNAILTGRMITELTATGGILILAIGLRLLEVARVRVGSFLPALVIAPAAVALFGR
jgi:uncharacterized membrane protein YqgA involved in biofilm formation